MLYRNQRHVHAGKLADGARPLACAVHDNFRLNISLIGHDAADAAIFFCDSRDATTFNDLHAAHARTLRQRLRDVGGIRLPIGRQESCADYIADIHDRPKILRFIRREAVHFQAKTMRPGCLAFDLGHAFGIACQAQAAIALSAGCLARFLFELVV